MRRAILNALRARYEAEIAEADATVNIYLSNSPKFRDGGVLVRLIDLARYRWSSTI